MLKIKKKLPIPGKPKRGRPSIYPIREMKVGECFDIPHGKKTGRQVGASIRAIACRLNPKSFSVFRHETFVRVWRVK